MSDNASSDSPDPSAATATTAPAAPTATPTAPDASRASSDAAVAAATGLEPSTQTDRQAMPVDAEEAPRLPFPVVGVGASAGGLEAFGEFISAVRPDSGMAFVFVQHLPPEHESLIPEILARRTPMPVAQIEEGTKVERDHVYVIRPGHVLTIKDGAFHLGPQLGRRAANRPIDDFFKSLAEEQRERAIAILLSGMGSNGTAGAQAIKAVGGLCIAQDPETAQFASMPRHLIEQGYADYVLRPEDIPPILTGYAEHPYTRERENHLAIARRDSDYLREIFAILRTRTRRDFSGYKKPTVMRRVQRRMGLARLTEIGEYAKILRQTPAEVSALADDLLIHVTGFFRDAAAWETLRTRVVAPLVEGAAAESSIRAWVAACSSGEEAYSLAMLLVEESERVNKAIDIKVFATDMADRTLAHARVGIYPSGIETDVSPERLSRFFSKDDAVYRVRQELRERVVFAPHNVLADPPFSRLDIVTCRNLLIYLEPELQQRVITMLHFGLRPGGVLFLGSNETISGADDLFEPLDTTARIFRRVGETRHARFDFPIAHPLRQSVGLAVGAAVNGEAPVAANHRPLRPGSITQITQRALLAEHTPPAVAVDRDTRVVYYHGDTQPYLEQPSGEPTRELLALARAGMRSAIRAALLKASSEQVTATVPDGWIESESGRRRVSVVASPIRDGDSTDYFLVSFADQGPSEIASGDGGSASKSADLAAELRKARDELQRTIAELQSSNEDLKASNEEVMSINEELQSTNEELETSKEEMQSLNEELTTVNAQLQAKMQELEGTSNDLESLLTSTDIAVLFLDPQFRIRRYTPAVRELLDLIATDVGRPLRDLARKFVDPKLDDDALAVLQRLVPIEREVSASNGHYFVRRVLPYRTTDNRIDGVVVTFVDITDRRRAEDALRARESEIRETLSAVETARAETERANRVMNEFFARASHELRGPLAAMEMWLDMLRSESASERAKAVGAISQSVTRQTRIISDLLDMARGLAGKLRVEHEPLNLALAVETTVHEFEPQAAKRSITLEFRDPNEALWASGDLVRVQQAVANLVSNAIKFSPDGSRVQVTLSREGDQARITVRDWGRGISPEFLPRVFTPYVQEDDSLTRPDAGLGLGLAIVKQIVELHGGTVDATSSGEGQGSTFGIRLPLIDPTNVPNETTVPTREPLRIDGVSVLVVDDDPPVREGIAAMLRQYGASVTAVGDVAAGLGAIARARFDLIVCDLAIPGQDGFSLIRQVRTLAPKDGGDTPAVALSGHAGQSDHARALEAGFQDHIAKPVLPKDLIAVVARFARRAG